MDVTKIDTFVRENILKMYKPEATIPNKWRWDISSENIKEFIFMCAFMSNMCC